MKKRSLSKMFLYTILSLGIYELVWLYQTRAELQKFSTVRIPSIRWLVLLNAMRFAAIVAGIVLAILLIQTNRSEPKVSLTCWREWGLSMAPETSGQVTLSAACRDLVERSNALTDREDMLIKSYLAVVALLLISSVGYPRWLRNYALAAQQVTRGKLSQTSTMLNLTFASVYGMIAVQDIFNRTEVAPNGRQPSFDPANLPGENRVVHRVLSVLALTMAIVFGIGIAFLIAINYIGTHH